MNDTFLDISALGRPTYLGQLYDAKSSKLLPGFSLYKSGAIKPRETSVESTTFKLQEIKSFSDRAKSLDISAQLSVSILGGAISISGGGSYLNKQQDTSESTTVAAIAIFRRRSKSLDLLDLQDKIGLQGDILAKTQATHVVTSIIYGANIVGTLTQKSIYKEDTTDISGNFSLEAFKSLSKVFSVEGKAELNMQDKEKLKNYNLDVELVTDIKLGDEKMPVEPVALLELVAKSPSLVGDGVPCEIQLTPLSMLFAESQIPSFRELAEADLIDICANYDDILTLENSRLWLRDTVDAHREIFPTFAAAVRKRTIAVTKLVQDARARLRVYLQRYRSMSDGLEASKDVGSTEGFITQITESFSAEFASYQSDRDEWRKRQDQLDAAERHGFPAIGVSAIGRKMNRANKGMLAVILVPDDSNWEALTNLYGDLGVDIRQWRQSIDKVPEGCDDSKASVTEFISIYADPLHTKTLETFDDNAGTLKTALRRAKETTRAVFLTYGRSRSHLGGFAWNVLNDEGWGIIINKLQNWRYIGDVHYGKPHGSGVMTYVNKTKYAGDFVFGQRDGLGKILDVEGKEVPGQSGVFIKNALDPDGVIVEVTVFDQSNIPVQHGTVALNKFAAVRTQVDRIGTVMDWDGEQQSLSLDVNDGVAKVNVVGSMIDSSEDPKVETSCWPLDGNAPKITARVR